MGHLRSAVRALASVELRPAELLEALDTFSRRYRVGAMTTVAYGQLNAKRGSFRFAFAGHPAPLIHEPGTVPRFVWEGRSLPINAYREPLQRAEAELALGPGTTLLLYTDGLIEHRTRPADQGMEELLRLVVDNQGQPLGTLVESIANGLYDPDASDDRSLVGVRLARENAHP
jgi:serine/threonine-protein kinase RsbW